MNKVKEYLGFATSFLWPTEPFKKRKLDSEELNFTPESKRRRVSGFSQDITNSMYVTSEFSPSLGEDRPTWKPTYPEVKKRIHPIPHLLVPYLNQDSPNKENTKTVCSNVNRLDLPNFPLQPLTPPSVPKHGRVPLSFVSPRKSISRFPLPYAARVQAYEEDENLHRILKQNTYQVRNVLQSSNPVSITPEPTKTEVPSQTNSSQVAIQLSHETEVSNRAETSASNSSLATNESPLAFQVSNPTPTTATPLSTDTGTDESTSVSFGELGAFSFGKTTSSSDSSTAPVNPTLSYTSSETSSGTASTSPSFTFGSSSTTSGNNTETAPNPVFSFGATNSSIIR
jgi:hypothetical protein